ncbi:MAG: hypothetical protein Q4G22_08795 [Paracoccus sp. (in: a-proteobacteria)]|uniref:hypothetical protein n=1 Tax=Paracoccus sp. TaxID=267 RepID=UPI0026DEE30F|nr:hypothetical protein [Paracoccus sp. (in: a-proteobacteria)]MDO5631922.1 hypothetical protein [Paracoccus sp. (in: a-proteobacteria)]
MELKPAAALTFSPPQPAFEDYPPGMSPYVHRWLDLRRELTPDPGDAAAPLFSQIEAALCDLIDRALGHDRHDGASPPDSNPTMTGAAP